MPLGFRLEVWNPILNNQNTDRWVIAQTPKNRSAVSTVLMSEELGNPRKAKINLSNRPVDFTTTGTFAYHYQQAGGANVFNSALTLPKRYGVLTHFFREFQYARLIDEETNLVIMAGRIYDVDMLYANSVGTGVNIIIEDSLRDLADRNPKEYFDSMMFYRARSASELAEDDESQPPEPTGGLNYTKGHKTYDIINAIINAAYKAEFIKSSLSASFVYVSNEIRGRVSDAATMWKTDDFTGTPIWGASGETGYKPNIVADDAGAGLRYRNQRDALALVEDYKLTTHDEVRGGWLGKLAGILGNARNEQDAGANSETFGYDYYVDANISYSGHADFKAKNLDSQTPPPPQMFNSHPRGQRIYNIEPASYGLAIKHKGRTGANVKSTNHKVDSSGTSYAVEPMDASHDFDFPKNDMLTTVLVDYNTAIDKDKAGEDNSKSGYNATQVMELINVHTISGQFRIHTISDKGSSSTETTAVDNYGSGTHIVWPKDIATRDGLKDTEWLKLYESDGTTQVAGGSRIAKIQYQSNASTGSGVYGFILVSPGPDYEKLFTVSEGSYVLKGVGNVTSYASNSTCVVNLGADTPELGFPRRVWGVKKSVRITKHDSEGLHKVRTDVANLLSRTTSNYVSSEVIFHGLPVYRLDAKVRTVSTVTGGQVITVENTNGDGSTSTEITRYGFRQGMLVTKMTDSSFSSIAQTNGKDVYGYCWDVPSTSSFSIDMTESVNLADGDYVRLYIPIRTGDVVRLENDMMDVSSNSLITHVEFTQEPVPKTMLHCSGINAGSTFDANGYTAKILASRNDNVKLSLPKGHQQVLWNGLFSAVDHNTVQWQTVGNKSDVILEDGSIYNVDCDTGSGGNTTDNSETDSTGKRFGLATPPNAGDATVYYIYLDPNHELATDGLYHFYTRPATSPATGSDPVYKQDGDNIIVGWFKAGATTTDVASVGTYKDAAPEQTKVAAALALAPNSLTSVLLRRGARGFTSDLDMRATAYNAVIWDNSNSSTNATLTFADGEAITITHGTKTSGLTDNTSWFFYLDGGASGFTNGGSYAITWTNVLNNARGDDKLHLGTVTVGIAGGGNASVFNGAAAKAPVINAGLLMADAVQSDHITSTGLIVGKHFTTNVNVYRSGSNNYAANTHSTAGVIMDDHGILGVSGGVADLTKTEFYMQASDGASYFGGGTIKMDKSGLTIDNATSASSTPKLHLISSYDGSNHSIGILYYNQELMLGSGAAADKPREIHLYTSSSQATIHSGPGNTHRTTIGDDSTANGEPVLMYRGLYLAGAGTAGGSHSYPPNPVALSGGVLFAKDDGHLYWKGHNTTTGSNGYVAEVQLSVAGGGGVQLGDTNVWTAQNTFNTTTIMNANVTLGNNATDITTLDSKLYIDNNGTNGVPVIQARGLAANTGIWFETSGDFHRMRWTHTGETGGPYLSFDGDDSYVVAGTGTFNTLDVSGNGDIDGNLNIDGYLTVDGGSYWPNKSSVTPSAGWIYLFANGNDFNFKQSDGTIITLSASYSSSLALKDNVRELEIDTSKVLALAPKTFEWKDADTVPEHKRGKKSFGLIAEEVHEVLPELVTYNDANEPKRLDYSMISILLLEEVKKLKARIEVLEGN